MPDARSAIVAVAAATAWALAISGIGSVPFAAAGAAVLAVYVFGYIPGALLVNPRDDRASVALAAVRLIAGLMLTVIAGFASLLIALPWSAGPVIVFVAAIGLHRWAAWLPPRVTVSVTWPAVLTALIAALLLAPTLIAAVRMAPGPFPPVFFNVDTSYFLEKVHALLTTSVYPPPSLGVADGVRPYHFGIHGMAALISRSAGIAPHHSSFLVVLPLLCGGMLAAATLAAQRIAPRVPRAASVALLLVAAPTLWYPFWDVIGPDVVAAVSTRSLAPLNLTTERYELWGVVSNNGQNLAAHFIVLASLAGVVTGRAHGWRLPVFLIGTAVIFKSPAAIALLSGFCVAQTMHALEWKRWEPLMPAAAAALLFGATYAAFWLVPNTPPEFKAEWFPLFHLEGLASSGRLDGFFFDIAWLLLPALVVFLARLPDRERISAPLLGMALAPFVIVNTLRSVDLRPGFGVDPDWVQIVMSVPVILHVFVLSYVDRRWERLTVPFRVGAVAVMVLAIAPPLFVAARYAHLLIVAPERGHEYVDNRQLAAALAAIPRNGTMIVTNDLRYPAESFSRDNRQMQIPALFGHQAFAVNYEYESYGFSRERAALQALLRAEEWTPRIEIAARRFGWTHLLVHKNYKYPAAIPLDRVFENASYVVYQFRRAGDSEQVGSIETGERRVGIHP